MTVSDRDLARYCEQWLEPEQLAGMGRDACLDLVMSFVVEPKLGVDAPVFLTRYPASQAALARVSDDDGFAVAHRFELYINGLELCNRSEEHTSELQSRPHLVCR